MQEENELLHQSIVGMESAIASAELCGSAEKSKQLQVARESLKQAIMSVCEISKETSKGSLSDLIEVATTNIKGRRGSAILILRALSVEGLLPLNAEHTLERKVVDLVMAGGRGERA